MDRAGADEPLVERIRDRTAELAIWGAGIIGLAAAEAFVEAGFKAVIIDIDEARVAAVNAGRVPLVGFEDRVRIDAAALEEGKLSAVTSDSSRWHDADIHIVCVNTDRGGVPVLGPLRDVLRLVASVRADRELVVVLESTVSPAWLRGLVVPAFGEHERLHLATAPRRDWMLSPDMNLHTLPRVIGVANEASRELLSELYSTVSKDVHFARDWEHAALTKPVENLFRFVDLVLTNQLRLAYPSMDMAEVLRLAGTKWNVPTYHPSVGIGGYCIPLSPHFALEQLDRSLLPMVRAALSWNSAYDDLMAEWVVQSGGEGSPGLALGRALMRRGVDVRIHDPYFTADETAPLSGGIPHLPYPEGLGDLKTLVFVTAHAAYDDLPSLVHKLNAPPILLDSLGLLRESMGDGTYPYAELGGVPARWPGSRPRRKYGVRPTPLD